MNYALSDGFTAKKEGANFWRGLSGRNQFRVISESFHEVWARWVNTADGKGYTKYWPFNSEEPDLEPGHAFKESEAARKQVIFIVSPVEGHDGGAPALLVVPRQVAEQILVLATELQGLTVADFVVIGTGSGMNKSYTVRAMDPTPCNFELEELGRKFDALSEL